MRFRFLPLVLAAVVATGCDLTEVDLVDFTDLVVVEAYAMVSDTVSDNRLRALVHGTAPGGQPSAQSFDDAIVTMTDENGLQKTLVRIDIAACVHSRPENASGSCFTLDLLSSEDLEPGELLTLEVSLADGRQLTGATRVPGDFALDGLSGTCRLPPNTLLPLTWSPSDSAWAYLSETSISGLPAALAAEGISAPDTLYLQGLSISESDTTVVFPSEFGIFDRLDLEHDLAVRLQRGLPAGAAAEVRVTAVDRNYVNWVRGGSFNPSGPVRTSSFVGAGEGVFGSAVTRSFSVASSNDTTVGPLCPGL